MNIEKQIEFDKVKEIWMNLAITDGAKEKDWELSLLFILVEKITKLQYNVIWKFMFLGDNNAAYSNM